MTTLTETTSALTGEYILDPGHSRIGFVGRHAMVTKVRGSFSDFEGSGYLDADDPARSHLEVTIQAGSVESGSGDRDQHLRSGDLFDVERYPEIRFVSTAVESAGDDTYRVAGDLTIKDVTKPVTLDLEVTGSALDPFGNTRLGLEGGTTLNRKDWGVSWNALMETGGVLVSEKIRLELDVSAIKRAA